MAAMVWVGRDSNDPVEDVLAKWIPRAVMRGRDVFDADELVRGLSESDLQRMIVDFDELLSRVETGEKDNIYFDIPALGAGELPAYVPPGPDIHRRVTHASLFADRVLVSPPLLPTWPVFWWDLDPADLILRRYASLEEPMPLNSPPSSDPLDELLDEIDRTEGWKMRLELAMAHEELSDQLGETARTLLLYWWDLRGVISDGWVQVIGRGRLSSDNIKAITRDPCFRAEYDVWDEHSPKNIHPAFGPWGDLMTATAAAHSLNRSSVVMFPGDPRTQELVQLVSRHYAELPYGGDFMISLPTKRLNLVGGGQLERGAWFDQLLLGMGPVAKLLDMEVVCELRASGVATHLRQWVASDLNGIAFASARGDSAREALEECRARLGKISDEANRVIEGSSSRLLRQILREGAVSSSAGLVTGVTTSLATEVSLPGAIAAGAIGFGVAAIASTLSANDPVEVQPSPVVFKLVQTLRRHG